MDNAAMEAEPPKVEQPKRKRRWFQVASRIGDKIALRKPAQVKKRMCRCISIAVSFSLLVCYVGSGVAAESETVESLRASRVEVAKLWLESLNNNFQPPTDPSEYYRAAAALRDAQLDAAKGRSERLKALKDYRDEVESLYEKINALHASNSVGGEFYRWSEAKFIFLTAKLRLKEEEAKTP